MTIEEMKEKRRLLAVAIKDLVNRFEQETGMRVIDIGINERTTSPAKSLVLSVNIRIEG